MIHEHVGSSQLGDRGVERGPQVAGVRGVCDVAADVLACGSKLGGVGVQPRLVAVEHSDRVSGIGEGANERDAEAGSDTDNYCGSERHGSPFFDGIMCGLSMVALAACGSRPFKSLATTPAPDKQVPALEFLDGCPASIDAQFAMVLDVSRCASTTILRRRNVGGHAAGARKPSKGFSWSPEQEDGP